MLKRTNTIICCIILFFLTGTFYPCLAAEDWHWRDGSSNDKPNKSFSGGNGTQSSPYLISSCQDMADLAYLIDNGNDFTGKYFRQTRDLVFNDSLLVDGRYNEKKDGTFKRYVSPGGRGVVMDDEFEGIFDGGGYTMKGLYMYCVLRNFHVSSGLFGYMENGEVKNVNLDEVYVSFYERGAIDYYCGIIAGVAEKSLISNCHVTNAVIQQATIKEQVVCGGLVGYAKNVVVSNSSFDGDIRSSGYSQVGGIVGLAKGCIIKGCKTSGSMMISEDRERQEIGGICCNATETTLSDCVSDVYIGMFFDFVYFEDMQHDFYVPCSAAYIGGLVALAEDCSFNRCASFGEICTEGMEYAQITNVTVAGMAAKVMGDAVFSDCVRYGAIKKMSAFSSGGYYRYEYIYNGFAYSKESNLTMKHCLCYNIFNTIGGDAGFDKMVSGEYDRVEIEDNYYWGVEENYEEKSFLQPESSLGNEAPGGLEYLKTTQLAHLQGLSNMWGVFNSSDEDRNGLPLPTTCGGMATLYSGKGTEAEPFVIKIENDLNALQQAVNSGNAMENIYFRLEGDINMSGKMNSIGTSEYPFKGHFDGNGHAIVGLRNSLFGYMYGTVKNLALLECNIQGWEITGAIANYVGNADNKAEISNCYVSGVVQAAMSGVSSAIYQGGICSELRNGSTVHDCYFMGHLIAKGFSNGISSGGLHLVGGIVGSNTNKSDTPSVSNCYASFDFHKVDLGMDPLVLTGICNNRMSNCYFVTSATNVTTGTGCTKLKSESELSASNLGSQWLQGVYRPILKSTKHYEATAPDGETAYFDAIPETNPKKNCFYNITIDDPYSDRLLWELPNLAVYVESEQMDYITNGYIDQSSELKYRRSEGATGTLGQLHFLLAQNDKGAHFVCLPGEVLKSDLPEGSDAMIVGKVTVVNDEELVNVVHVDTIPAGVPCFLYVPVTSVKSGNNIDMLMRSGIVSEPVMDADYSSFKGTFSPQTVSEQACLDVAKETLNRAATRGAAQVEDAYYFIRSNEQAEVKPFSAWIESSLGNVRIVDYLLLDEYGKSNEELIENSTDDVNIKMRLTMNADKWTTVCLPFDMSTDEIKEKFGQDTKLEEIESISYDGTTLNIKLKEVTEGIVNGYPYFIKPSASNSIFDLGPRILSNELSEDGYMALSPDATRELSLKMGGAYDMSMLSSTKDYGAYYFNDGTLIKVSSDTPFTLGGFRCWFKVSDATASAPAELSSVVITHSDGTTTEIGVVAKDPQAAKQTIYDLRGIEMKTEKGLFIKNGIKVIK